MYTVRIGDCLEVMAGMEENSVDAIVTDPPYGLRFMNKKWDYDVPSVVIWREALRVLKPGGHLLAFGGTRTYHRMVVNIEDAGFEIRDQLDWLYGEGWPKSHDISKAIDKMHGAEREIVGVREDYAKRAAKNNFDQFSSVNQSDRGLNSRAFAERRGEITAPATDEAVEWQGWGTALKPAHEPIVLARKPFSGAVAANVLKWRTGALNIDASRVGTSSTPRKDPRNGKLTKAHMEMRPWMERRIANGEPLKDDFAGDQGRWPANVIHDGSEEVLSLFPETSSGGYPPAGKERSHGSTYAKPNKRGERRFTHSSGSAARFFYCAKASRRERNEGLEDGQSNDHPTVKPKALLVYLCRLITPPGGTVLDPFCGSGSTGRAAVSLGFDFIGIEIDPRFAQIARERIAFEIADTAFGLHDQD